MVTCSQKTSGVQSYVLESSQSDLVYVDSGHLFTGWILMSCIANRR